MVDKPKSDRSKQPSSGRAKRRKRQANAVSGVRARRLRAGKLLVPEPQSLDEALALWRYLLRPDMPLMGCFSGVRGGGKSLGAVWELLVDFLVRGRKVWSNIPIGVNITYKGETREFTSDPFDSEMMFSFDDDLRDGAVFIDEANYWVDSRRSSSNKNLLFADIAQQIRKRDLDLRFTVQFENWLESRLRQMMDVVIKCNDLHLSQWGDDENVERGTEFLWRVQDWSGALTGQAYHETGEEQQLILSGGGIWPIYTSKALVDIWTARQGIEIEQDKMKVTIGMGKDAKIEAAKARFGDIHGRIRAMVEAGDTKVPSEDMYRTFGIDQDDHSSKIALGKQLKNFGIKSDPSAGTNYYDLSHLRIPEGE